jgi:undecaprenyl-diphosphatase
MDLLQAIVLGIVQGAPEFLPISSSGHLILARNLMGLQQYSQTAFVFDVLIQMGTWLAVVIFYWRDIVAIGRAMLFDARSPQARLGWLIMLATLPAVLVGWLLKDSMSGNLSGLSMSGLFLIVNAVILSLAEYLGKRLRDLSEARPADALTVGAFQALALLPAISRSASALAGGMLRNFTRPEAARFAFLMAVPIMPAAALVAWLDLGTLPDANGLLLPLAAGFVASAVVGYLAIRWLLGYLSRSSLFPFAIYCLLVGTVALLVG